MVGLLRLTRWEWFKLRHRWMPWILVAIAAALCQFYLWSMFYSYVDREGAGDDFFYFRGPDAAGERTVVPVSCTDIWEGTADAKLSRVPEAHREDALETLRFMRETDCPERLKAEAQFKEEGRWDFVLPLSLANGIGIAHGIGVALIVILASSSIGVEYGWGTLRAALTRGIGRWQFLGAKALSLLLMSGAGLVVAGLTVAASSLVAATLTLEDGRGLTDAGEWSKVAVMFGKAVYGLAPYAVLGLFLSVLTSSSSMGIAIGLAYVFAELILIGILGGLLDWFDNVSDFMLGPQVASWMTEAGVGTTSPESSWFSLVEFTSQTHAFLVVAAYIVVLATVAFWLFQRKDIAGARGD